MENEESSKKDKIPGEQTTDEAPDGQFDETLKYHHEQADPEDNRNTTPPEDERIEIHSIWVAECYAPSHTDDLLSGIRGLGWDQEKITDFFTGGVTGWLEEGRKSPFGGSWLNLNIIERPGQKRFVGTDLKVAELPTEVDYAQGYAFNVLSSLTIITIQFILTDEAVSTLEKPLHTSVSTIVEQKGNVRQFMTVPNQKQEAVEKNRVELRRSCASWFKDNLPGLFSGDTLEGDFPTCEFITLQQARPFERPPDKMPHDSYLWLLGMDHDSDAWDNPDLAGLRLEVPFGGYQKHPYSLVLAGKKDEIGPDEDFSMYGGRNRSGYAGWLSSRVDSLLVIWTLHALLRAYEQRLAGLRDQAGALDLRRLTNMAEKLQSMQADLVQLSGDLLPLSSELTEFSETEERFVRYAEEFRPVMTFLRDRDLRLLESLRQSVLDRSKRVRGLEAEVRQVLMTIGTIASTISQERSASSQERATNENLRLQSQVERLTRVLVVLTIVLVAIGIATILATILGS